MFFKNRLKLCSGTLQAVVYLPIIKILMNRYHVFTWLLLALRRLTSMAASITCLGRQWFGMGTTYQTWSMKAYSQRLSEGLVAGTRPLERPSNLLVYPAFD